MAFILFKNELRAVLRDGRGLVTLLLGLLLALISTWTSASTHARQDIAHDAATGAARNAWNDREGDSPHSRAHYGDYVFRPAGPLATLDSGLQAVTGRVIFTEGHRQNVAVHKPQQEAASLLRYDRLEPATVLQLLAPLVLILIGFGVISSERETGRLKLLIIQGVRPLSLLLAKSFALWAIGVVLCVLVVGMHLLFAEEVDVGRTFVFLLLHLVVLWIVAALVVAVSARSRQSGAAAALLLSFWVLSAIVLPRFAAMTATILDPLPTRDVFQASMDEDREQGMDGHNPRDSRRQELEQEVLAKYGVSSRDELPVNLGGLIMQADEEYGAKVWDKHFGGLEDHLKRQYEFAGLFSFLNPLQSADRLSMAIAGTGLASHLDFLRATEEYRREMVRKLNEEDAFGVTRAEDGRRSRTTTQDFYTGFNGFDYQPLSLGVQLLQRRLDLIALCAWLVGSTLLLGFTARKFNRGGVL
jgi:ABC-2 type transport system permease protein